MSAYRGYGSGGGYGDDAYSHSAQDPSYQAQDPYAYQGQDQHAYHDQHQQQPIHPQTLGYHQSPSSTRLVPADDKSALSKASNSQQHSWEASHIGHQQPHHMIEMNQEQYPAQPYPSSRPSHLHPPNALSYSSSSTTTTSSYGNSFPPAVPGFVQPSFPQDHLHASAAAIGLGEPGAIVGASVAPPASYHDANYFVETRERIMRKRTIKHIELQDGNLVIDFPVASSISTRAQDKLASEFSTARYQAVTCSPDQFIARKYTLRPWLSGRKTELCIVMTAYNEDDVLFARTMGGVIKNIAHLESRTRSSTWGKDSWKKVVVVIVSDGRKKANQRMLKALGLMGCYNEGVMKDHVLNQPVQAHLFEYTTQVQVTDKGQVKVTPCPIQVVFCLKEQNKKKLNSHKWFFSFCDLLQPNVCVLLDVGTKPSGTSIYDLWKSFDANPKVGGACGEICVDTGRGCVGLLNPLVASQNFEYKISSILDKSTESVFGFIGVLPGAFSAYRFKALQGRPLEMYFKGEDLHSGASTDNSIFTANMYLAEDRILCFELVTKKDHAWLLRFVKSAKAYTDVPSTVPEFISQRRRWLNGSLFASYYATWHWYRILSSGQSAGRKLWLLIQAVYNLVQLIFAWFTLANFFLAFFFLMNSATSSSNSSKQAFGDQGDAVAEVFQNLYIAMIIVVLVCSLGNRPQGSKFAYTSAILVFACIMGVALYCAGFSTYLALDAAGLTSARGWTVDNIETLFKLRAFRDIVISLAATYVLYFAASILHLQPWHMVTCFVQYLFLTPTYTVILSIYSMANTNDISWGTKGQDSASHDLGKAEVGNKKDGKETVKVKVPTSSSEAEELWQSYRSEISVPAKEVRQKRDANTKKEDHARNFRTNLMLLWFASNATVVIVFTSKWWLSFVRDKLYSPNHRGPIVNPYQTLIFWATAGLAAFRAFGSLTYLVLRLFGH
ncbi:hypothetical protein IE53DRAFT_390589 [Violaceomyces palustris]|uniref:Uncharacterized protein n=1 Tax=Violaceomyces palustris TaxID=1673888 RepID=A0ACD0NNB0_9BASI|nr:hypothetical protein IE53DRAFT_390589 [Violaceomyces palustris]